MDNDSVTSVFRGVLGQIEWEDNAIPFLNILQKLKLYKPKYITGSNMSITIGNGTNFIPSVGDTVTINNGGIPPTTATITGVNTTYDKDCPSGSTTLTLAGDLEDE